MTTLASHPRRSLTPRQRDVLKVIRHVTEDSGAPPTLQVIGNTLSISKVVAFEHVTALKKKGYLATGERQLRILDDPKDEAIRDIAKRLRAIAASRDLEFEEAAKISVIAQELAALAGRVQ